ncbi:signal peptidase II [Brachybacterium hainanense]|uniref:Lipoprotein signal peptidase n=1 Tax=Brachybacterium hainanense TaxID=1541174 RepID=A0ABV6RFJ8_9MICO
MSHSATDPLNAGRDASGVRRPFPLSAVLATVLAIGIVLAVVDQITKNWAVANLPPYEGRPLLGEVLQLFLLYNSGAAWGMGSGATPIVTALQMLICVGVLVFAVRTVRSPWWSISLGLIIGGALGNIHDRLLRAPGPFHGEVVDFLQLPHWPVFNVADMGVVAGAVLLVLLSVLGVSADPAAEAQEEAS